MNRYQKQNEYYRKSVELANLQFIPTTMEIGVRNKEMQTKFYKLSQFYKKLNKEIERNKTDDRNTTRNN